MIETEIKLKTTKQEIEKLIFLDNLESKFLQNTYFDTPNSSFSQNYFAVRIRVDNGEIIQTLKTSGKNMLGIAIREEFDWILPENKLDIALIKEKLPAHLHSDVLNLQSIFTTNFTRLKQTINLATSQNLEFLDLKQSIDSDLTLEIAIDEGLVQTDTKAAKIFEIELELKRGDNKDLLLFALFLSSKIAVFPSSTSKAKQGFILLNQVTPRHTINTHDIKHLINDISNCFEFYEITQNVQFLISWNIGVGLLINSIKNKQLHNDLLQKFSFAINDAEEMQEHWSDVLENHNYDFQSEYLIEKQQKRFGMFILLASCLVF